MWTHWTVGFHFPSCHRVSYVTVVFAPLTQLTPYHLGDIDRSSVTNATPQKPPAPSSPQQPEKATEPNLYCSACKKKFNSEPTWKNHLKSAKHIANEKKGSKNNKGLRWSIYSLCETEQRNSTALQAKTDIITKGDVKSWDGRYMNGQYYWTAAERHRVRCINTIAGNAKDVVWSRSYCTLVLGFGKRWDKRSIDKYLTCLCPIAF